MDDPFLQLICDIKRECRKKRAAPIIVVPECAVAIIREKLRAGAPILDEKLTEGHPVMFNGVQFIGPSPEAMANALDRWNSIK